MKLRELAQSKVTGWVWQIAALALCLLTFQQVAGWPLHRDWPVRSSENAPPAWHYPAKAVFSRWNMAMVRVFGPQGEVPRAPEKQVFTASKGEYAAVTARGVSIIAAAPAPGVAVSSAWTVQLPWLLTPACFLALLGAGILTTAGLAMAGQPAVTRWWRWWKRDRVPWPSLAVAGAAFFVAVAVRRYGFSFPSWENDTGSYFASILHTVEGGLPLATPDRPFAWPLAAGLLLRRWPDFRVIVSFHQVASLAAGGAMGGAVWLSGERLFTHPALRTAGRLLGCALFAVFTLDEVVLQREWFLLSEASAALYLGVQITLLWSLAARSWRLPAALALYGAFCLAGLLIFFTRANWGFALGLLPLPWVVACFQKRGSRRDFVLWAAGGAAMLAALTLATFSFQYACRPASSSSYLYDRARALICWNVPLIQPELDRRLQADPNQPVLAEMAILLRAEVERARNEGSGSYPSFNVDPDRLYFEVLPRARQFRSLSVEERTALCADLFRSGLRRHPELFLRRTAVQMKHYFRSPYWMPFLYLPNVELSLRRSQQALDDGEMPPFLRTTYAPEVAQAWAKYARPWPSVPRLALSEREALIFRGLLASFTWCLALPVTLFVVTLSAPALRRRVDWAAFRPTLTLAAWSAGSSILSALSAAITQGLDVQRYIELAIPATLLGQVLWPLLGLALLLALCRHAPGSKPAALPSSR